MVRTARERDVPLKNPETCPHLNKDHRGLTKKALRTYCKDCCTVIDAALRDLTQEVARELEISPEERELLERVPNYSQASKTQVIQATQLMLENARNLDDGSFSVREIMNMFLDCVDASRAQVPIAFVQTHVENEDSESEEENSRL